MANGDILEMHAQSVVLHFFLPKPESVEVWLYEQRPRDKKHSLQTSSVITYNCLRQELADVCEDMHRTSAAAAGGMTSPPTHHRARGPGSTADSPAEGRGRRRATLLPVTVSRPVIRWRRRQGPGTPAPTIDRPPLQNSWRHTLLPCPVCWIKMSQPCSHTNLCWTVVMSYVVILKRHRLGYLDIHHRLGRCRTPPLPPLSREPKVVERRERRCLERFKETILKA